MDNASLILRTLDQFLDHPVRLILYGRSALQLGFSNPPVAIGHSKDVDAIIPIEELELLTADQQFWDAQEATNGKLRPQGLRVPRLRPDDPRHLDGAGIWRQGDYRTQT